MGINIVAQTAITFFTTNTAPAKAIPKIPVIPGRTHISILLPMDLIRASSG